MRKVPMCLWKGGISLCVRACWWPCNQYSNSILERWDQPEGQQCTRPLRWEDNIGQQSKLPSTTQSRAGSKQNHHQEQHHTQQDSLTVMALSTYLHPQTDHQIQAQRPGY